MHACTVGAVLTFAGMVLPCAVRAESHKLPLDAGRVPAQRLLDTVGIDAGLPRAKTPFPGSIDLSGENGALFVQHLQATLGTACEASIADGALTVVINGKAV